MLEVGRERRRQLEEAYDRESDPLISAAYLILSAYDELRHSGRDLELDLRNRLAGLFESVEATVCRRLDESLKTTEIRLPNDHEA